MGRTPVIHHPTCSKEDLYFTAAPALFPEDAPPPTAEMQAQYEREFEEAAATAAGIDEEDFVSVFPTLKIFCVRCFLPADSNPPSPTQLPPPQ